MLGDTIVHQEFKLTRDCPATIIPAGDEVVLEKQTVVTVTQALGGAITVRTPMGLFRVASKDIEALGSDARDALEIDKNSKITISNEPFSQEQIWDALRQCFDPEIPINIVDLGLIYDLTITQLAENQNKVEVKMTLTAQGCGMGPSIAADAQEKILQLPAVTEAQVDIVWDPPWNPHMISEEGRKRLGFE